jgi:hypothetical protein
LEKKLVQSRPRRLGRVILRSISALLILALGYALLWLQPLPATEPALGAMQSDNNVTVTSTTSEISFLPKKTATTGFIFYPGALVDPRAYAYLMHAFATQGYAAFIVKMPLNISFLGQENAAGIIAAHPQVSNWAIGGHSLGGVSASTFAASHREIKGLLLYASYPASDLTQQLQDKVVVSVYGTRDGLADPASIAKSRTLLPTNTRFVAIEGGIHSFFGNYGLQSGDGQPTISREQAQQQIIATSLNFLSKVATSGNAQRKS